MTYETDNALDFILYIVRNVALSSFLFACPCSFYYLFMWIMEYLPYHSDSQQGMLLVTCAYYV